MASNNIQIEAKELLAQSSKIQSVSDEYQKILKDVNIILEKVNSDWSSNMSNSFVSKIKKVTNMSNELVNLLNGSSKAAKYAAESFESLDGQLAKLTGDSSEISASGGSVIGVSRTFGENSATFWELLKEKFKDIPDGFKDAQEAMAFLEKMYGKLPDSFKEIVGKLVPENLALSIQLTNNLIQGKLSKGDLFDVIDYTSDSYVTASIIKNAFNFGFGEDVSKLEIKVETQLMEDIKSLRFYNVIPELAEYVVDGLGGGVIEVGLASVGDFIDSKYNYLPGSSYINDIITKWDMGKFESHASDGSIDSAGEFFHAAGDFLNDGLDKVTDYLDNTRREVVDGFYDGTISFFSGLFK